MAKLEIVKDSEGNKIVLIPEILFFNKQNIENCASHSRYFSDELDAQFF